MGSLFGGSKKSTSTVTLPKPTADELALTQQQVQLAQTQLGNLSQIGAFTSDVFEQVLPELVTQINRFLPKENQITAQTLGFAGGQIGAQDELLQQELASIRNGFSLTPEQEKLIGDSANAAIEAGTSDISRFRDESLRALAQETSQARGLRPEDTPILDVGGRIVNESSRQAAQLISGIRSQEAQQKLQYPIQAGESLAGRIQAQQTMGQSTMQFVEQLRQQAFANRLALTGTVGELGLNLAQIGPNPSTLSGLQEMRANSATKTVKEKGGGFTDFLKATASFAGGLGGLMTGAKDIGLGFAS
jgi:hypothetical protein